MGRDCGWVEGREERNRMGEAQERDEAAAEDADHGAWDVCGERGKLFGGRDRPGGTVQNPQAHGEGLERTPADQGSQPGAAGPCSLVPRVQEPIDAFIGFQSVHRRTAVRWGGGAFLHRERVLSENRKPTWPAHV